MFMIVLFFLVRFTSVANNLTIISTFVFITIRVVEARVGIALLTIIIRNNGNDYMYVHMFENKYAIYSTNSHDLLQLETFFGYEL